MQTAEIEKADLASMRLMYLDDRVRFEEEIDEVCKEKLAARDEAIGLRGRAT